MRIAMRTDFCGNDMDRVVEYAHTLGITDIWDLPTSADCYDEAGIVEVGRLEKYKRRFSDEGLDLGVLTASIDEKAVISTESAMREARPIRQMIEAMGKVGIDLLFFFLNIPVAPEKDAAEQQWKHLIEFYQEIVSCAEDSQVRIATHGHQFSNFIIYNCAGFSRLLEAVPSDYNGVTFCPGCHKLAGDDIYEAIHQLEEKIFFAHARDVMREHDTFKDVIFDSGEVDMLRVLRQLQQIGYEGLVCPEHLPKVKYEPHDEITSAWSLGYLASALSTLSIEP
ncbi:MAG: mannonate dehydratase [Planctomycetota bacterium]|nr:mannonate dehydratase [Planctomycetota bacterium]